MTAGRQETFLRIDGRDFSRLFNRETPLVEVLQLQHETALLAVRTYIQTRIPQSNPLQAELLELLTSDATMLPVATFDAKITLLARAPVDGFISNLLVSVRDDLKTMGINSTNLALALNNSAILRGPVSTWLKDVTLPGTADQIESFRSHILGQIVLVTLLPQVVQRIVPRAGSEQSDYREILSECANLTDRWMYMLQISKVV